MHSPGDERMLYVDRNGAVVSAYTDGTEPDTISPMGWSCWTPAWSPDGKEVVFSSDESGEPQLYVMGADGSTPTVVFPWAERMFDDVQLPSWSSKGLIAFEAFKNYSSGSVTSTWTVAPDGSGLIAVTLGNDDEGAPAWSPDGSALAMHSGGTLWIWRSDHDDHQLTMPSPAEPLPVWTPAGDAIVYSVSDPDDGIIDVRRIRVDGTDDTPLASPPRIVGRPTVSRDGKTIAFDMDQGYPETYEVDTVPSGGGTPVRLLTYASEPQYQP